MPVHKKVWWKRVFAKKRRTKKVNVLKDIKAVDEFCEDMHLDIKRLRKNLATLLELEKELHVAKSGIVHINLETQGALLEKILQHYEFILNDADINGQRIKIIASEFLARAKRAGLKDLVDEKKKSRLWSFAW